MNMTTIYKEDYSDEGWGYILRDLELSSDTDEITVKHVSHLTPLIRTKNREKQNADKNNNGA